MSNVIKATKKPVTIDAIQLLKTNVKDVYSFIYGDRHTFKPESKWEAFVDSVIENGFRLMTLESDGQTQVADIGDYIIKGVAGEFYPCKPDIFHATYDVE